MAQPPDVSRDDVLRAIHRFDADGHDETIRRYKPLGYAEARDYFINMGDGRYYDTKLLTALAVEVRDGAPPVNNWSGGADHVVARLRKLGFTVTEPVPWNEDELTLVCDVVATH